MMNSSIDSEEHLREIHALIDSENFAELFARTEQFLALPHPPGITAELRRARALAHTGLGDWKSAVAEWDKVIDLLPERPSSYRGRGAARERLGDAAGAVADFARALELAPRRAASHNVPPRSGVRTEAVWARAMDGYRSDVESSPLDAHRFCCCGGGHQGPQMACAAYRKRGYCDRSEDTFTHTLEENPDNVQAWFDRASIRHCKREWDGVIADCSRALALKPEFAAVYCLRGSAYDKKGELAKAVADWTRVIELRPDDVMAYSLRSLAYEVLGEDDKAQADRVRAFELSSPQAVP